MLWVLFCIDGKVELVIMIIGCVGFMEIKCLFLFVCDRFVSWVLVKFCLGVDLGMFIWEGLLVVILFFWFVMFFLIYILL